MISLGTGRVRARIRRRPIMPISDWVRMIAFTWVPFAALAGVLDLTDLVVGLIGGACGILLAMLLGPVHDAAFLRLQGRERSPLLG